MNATSKIIFAIIMAVFFGLPLSKEKKLKPAKNYLAEQTDKIKAFFK